MNRPLRGEGTTADGQRERTRYLTAELASLQLLGPRPPPRRLSTRTMFILLAAGIVMSLVVPIQALD